MKYICEHCRNQVTDSQSFCHECGSQLEQLSDKTNVNELTRRAANSNIAKKARELANNSSFNNIKKITVSENAPEDNTLWEKSDTYNRQNESVEDFLMKLDKKGYTKIHYKTSTLGGASKVYAIAE